jgi:hypothetical protein
MSGIPAHNHAPRESCGVPVKLEPIGYYLFRGDAAQSQTPLDQGRTARFAGEARILTKPEEIETWMTAPAEEALKLQQPLRGDGSLKIVATGVKKDEPS